VHQLGDSLVDFFQSRVIGAWFLLAARPKKEMRNRNLVPNEEESDNSHQEKKAASDKNDAADPGK
jgi:hypothetical protein